MADNFLTPEQAASLSRMDFMSEEQKSLEEQLRHARELRKGRGQSQHTTGLGAAMGGFADGVNDVLDRKKEQDLLHEQDLNRREQSAHEASNLIQQARAQGYMASPTPDQSGPNSMGHDERQMASQMMPMGMSQSPVDQGQGMQGGLSDISHVHALIQALRQPQDDGMQGQQPQDDGTPPMLRRRNGSDPLAENAVDPGIFTGGY